MTRTRGVLDPPRFFRASPPAMRGQRSLVSTPSARCLVEGSRKSPRTSRSGTRQNAQELYQQLRPYLAAGHAPANVATVDSQDLVRGNESDVVILMVDVFMQQIVTHFARRLEPLEHGMLASSARVSPARSWRSPSASGTASSERNSLSVSVPQGCVGSWYGLENSVAGASGDSQRLARNGVGQCIGGSPATVPLFIVVPTSTENSETNRRSDVTDHSAIGDCP